MRPILTSATDKVDAQCAYPATISPLSGASGALRPPPARRLGAEDRRHQQAAAPLPAEWLQETHGTPWSAHSGVGRWLFGWEVFLTVWHSETAHGLCRPGFFRSTSAIPTRTPLKAKYPVQ